MKIARLLIGIGLATLLACTGNNKKMDNQTTPLRVIATTDVHGSIFPYDFISGEKAEGSLAGFMKFVREQQSREDQAILLLDNGDILQGQPPVYYYNTEATDTTHICSSIMNFIGYDAASVGNHDIEAGHPVYDKLMHEFNFPWLAANAVHEGTDEPYFQPYTIINRGGMKIAVLGMITPAIHKWLPPSIWAGIEFRDMIQSAERWIPVIQEQENPDLMIGLFHAGLDYTYDGETATTPKNENASLLVARQVPGLDIVIAGHDHQVVTDTLVNKARDTVHIINPGGNANHAGVFTIKQTRNGPAISTEIVDLTSYEPDSAFMQTFSPQMEKVKDYVNQDIGTFASGLESRKALWGPSPFVDLIHRVQLDLSGADISFTAPLAFDVTIPEGKVQMSDMFKLYRYENLLYTMSLTGKEIRDFLEYSYANWFNTMDSPQAHLLNFKTDKKGNLVKSDYGDRYELETPYFNYSSAAGLRYTVDVSKPRGERVNIISLTSGKPFDPQATYTVAVNSYRGSGGGGHLTRGAGISREQLQERILDSTPKDLRYYLGKWIKNNSPVTAPIISDWRLLPKDWVKKARKKDRELI